jgi:FdhE protein
MTGTLTILTDLKRQRPEWSPWLSVVEEIVREVGKPVWDAAVPGRVEARDAGVPLLAGVTPAVQPTTVSRLLKQMVRIAARGGTSKLASLEAAITADLDIVRLFDASVRQDTRFVATAAALSRTDPDAFQAVVPLLAVPFLQACNRRWAEAIPESWTHGYCPVCGSWPAFAEVRGIERRRYYRCGRCGGEWHANALSCAYCATSNHNDLVALVPGNGGSSRGAIDACRRCLGYVKTLTTLQGCAPGAVMLEDLATVALDVAALEQGYVRPQGSGYQCGSPS